MKYKLNLIKDNKIVGSEYFKSEEDLNEWMSIYSENNSFGNPERWEKREEEPEKHNGTRIIEDQTTGERFTEYLIPSDYKLVKVDLDKDYDYLLNLSLNNRRKEYPKIEDYLDAIVKGDELQKQAYIDACLAVKAKYPKPAKDGE